LVTGAGTFLGHPLALRLVEGGTEVKAIYRTTNQWVDGLANRPGIELIQADLSDAQSLSRARIGDCQVILHLAATSPRPDVGVADLIRDNVLATSNLCAYALNHGVKTFIFMSSMSVYGQVTGSVVGAQTATTNPSPYGATKRLCEQMLEDASDRLATIALRLPAILGKGARRHWLATVLERAKAGEQITIHNPAAPFNNAVDANYLAIFIAALTNRELAGFTAVPLASQGYLSIRDVVRKIVDGFRSPSETLIRESSTLSFTIDYSAAESLFAYRPPGISEAIDNFVAVNLRQQSS
jgi:nucleoside-diphosphate-sugar epimerase